MTKGHLTNEEFAEHLLGAGQSPTAEHIASCAECRQEAERVANALSAFKTWAHEESQTQAVVNVWAMAPAEHKRPARRSVFAWSATAAMTVLALALTLMLGESHSGLPARTNSSPGQSINANKPATQIAQSQRQISDDELLLEVQQALDSSVPRALEPAALLASERNRVIQETRNQ